MAGTPGNITILGSTGSIGRQTLEVIRANNGAFRVTALSGARSIDLLTAQALEWRPEYVAVADAEAAEAVKTRLAGTGIIVEAGPEALVRAAVWSSTHTVVGAVVGFAGLRPVLAALEEGKHVALANKEALVAGGGLVRQVLAKGLAALVPVDSEHSSIFQCLQGRGSEQPPRSITITASGGPFLKTTAQALRRVTPRDALAHPTWRMGVKNTIDSATLMNKGLEVIEAAVLFGMEASRIHVLVHPQSIVHGFAEYEDGAVLAALFEPDMRVPIAFALSYLRSDDPLRRPGSVPIRSGAPLLDLARRGTLEFCEPDHERFPALRLCYSALEQGSAAPIVLNAANEIAVEAFLGEQIGFCDIAEVVRRTLAGYQAEVAETIDDICSLDARARAGASIVVGALAAQRAKRHAAA